MLSCKSEVIHAERPSPNGRSLDLQVSPRDLQHALTCLSDFSLKRCISATVRHM